jgi:hypothetical protein
LSKCSARMYPPRPYCRFLPGQSRSGRVSNKVSIDKDDRNARLAEHGSQSAVDLVTFRYQLNQAPTQKERRTPRSTRRSMNWWHSSCVCFGPESASSSGSPEPPRSDRSCALSPDRRFLRQCEDRAPAAQAHGRQAQCVLSPPRFGECAGACTALYQPSFN